MKSYNHLMKIYLSDDTYEISVHDACLGKHSHRRQARAGYIREHKDELKPELIEYARHFYNKPHRPKQIYDGVRRKQRTIIVPYIEEQVVHHMIVNTMRPIWLSSMYEHSYGSIPGRGAHKAKARIERWIAKGGRDMKYCLKMDIRKYFDSVSHSVLKRKLSEQIHDAEFLQVMLTLVDATEKGLPLGFYTSQWLANWYLEGLDHFIKEDLRARYYVRYMDDMVIFGGNKKVLHEMRRRISEYLETELELELKGDWQVFLFDYVDKNGDHRGRFLDFLGFRFYRDRTTLRRQIMLKATRKAARLRKKHYANVYDCRQMLSYLGWIDCTDTYGMYKRYIKPNISFRRLRKNISRYDKKRSSENVERSRECNKAE